MPLSNGLKETSMTEINNVVRVFLSHCAKGHNYNVVSSALIRVKYGKKEDFFQRDIRKNSYIC